MKAVFLDFATVRADSLDARPLAQLTAEFTVYDDTPGKEVSRRIEGCEFVYVNKVRITREIIERARSLRFIGLAATGVDNIDLDAARERDIAVCNIRGYCTRSVVEHVFAVLLQFTHSIGLYHASVRHGDWQEARNFCMLDHPIRELSAMTLGIVGYGELGRGVAGMAEAFGMRVAIAVRPGTRGNNDKRRMGLDEMLRTSDVITLHCPLTPETRSLIGRRELDLMKPTAILINTARGGLVDSTALVDALANRRIAAAAIDVLSHEPPAGGDPLLDYRGDNLIVTPHIAWATAEARQNAIDALAANVAAFLSGEHRNRVA